MEYLDGLDLQRLVTRFGPQPAERVIMLLRQACRSLAESHERGLVHRDIKPANVFVTRLGTEYDYVKVLDFGVVKEQAGPQATMITHAGMVQGTPAFMPPEIVMGETRIDGRADLYSLACTAYWVLTAQTLFEGNTPAQMLLQHVQAQPVRPRRDQAIDSQIVRGDSRGVPRERSCKATVVGLDLDARLSQVVCDAPWTNEIAQEWWESHAPEPWARLDHQGNARRNQHRADRLLESPARSHVTLSPGTSRSLRSDRPDRRGRNGRGVSRERYESEAAGRPKGCSRRGLERS